MRILFFLTGGRYGSEHAGIDLMKVTLRSTTSVGLVCAESDVSLIERARALSVDVATARFPEAMYSLRAVLRYRKRIQSYRADLVVTLAAHPARFVVQAAALSAGVPVVAHVGTQLNWRASPVLRFAQRSAVSIISRSPKIWYAAQSPALVTELLSIGIRANRIRLIPPPLDLDRLSSVGKSAVSRAQHDAGLESGPILGCVGVIEPNKGQLRAIRVLASVQQKFPEAKLLIIGGTPGSTRLDDTPYILEIRRVLKNLRLEEAVTFTGYLPRDQVWRAMTRMDALLHFPVKEGFGLVVAEAMYLGVPVVASPVGGLSYLLPTPEYGELVNPDDLQQAGTKVANVLAADGARDRVAKARHRVLHEIGMSDLPSMVRDLYTTVTFG